MQTTPSSAYKCIWKGCRLLDTTWCWPLLQPTLQGIPQFDAYTLPQKTSFLIKHEHMPYYRGPWVLPANNTNNSSNAAHCQTIVSTVMVSACHGIFHLSNILVQFGNFGQVPAPNLHALNNDKFSCYAQQDLQFSWAVNSFQGGHFASTIQSWNLPFHISLACNLYKSRRSHFLEFTSCC